jgi:hypothetical protein
MTEGEPGNVQNGKIRTSPSEDVKFGQYVSVTLQPDTDICGTEFRKRRLLRNTVYRLRMRMQDSAERTASCSWCSAPPGLLSETVRRILQDESPPTVPTVPTTEPQLRPRLRHRSVRQSNKESLTMPERWELFPDWSATVTLLVRWSAISGPQLSLLYDRSSV